MFCFNASKNTIFISGAEKEDLEKQTFYSVNFGKYKSGEELIATKLLEIPAPILSPTMLYSHGFVYFFGGYKLNRNGSKSVSNKCFQYSLSKKLFKPLESMPFNLVNSTALQSLKVKNRIYLFGGYSDQVDLTGEQLNYLEYDLGDNKWCFKANMGIKSPFLNSRIQKPILDVILDDVFVSINLRQEKYEIRFFEPVKGGINLKFECPLPKNGTDDLATQDDLYQ